MPPAERLKVLLFLALFSGAVGALLALLSCGTEYWLLAAESCSGPEGREGESGAEVFKPNTRFTRGVRVFHEGLFWRCSFMAASDHQSVWDLWISNPPQYKVCQAAFLFPFPVSGTRGSPAEPYESPSAIVFRTFWSFFLVAGAASVVAGGFMVICAGPLANHRLYRVGGGLLLCGGLSLLAVLVMYLTWVQILDTLEQFALHHRASTCPSFHLSVRHGPSFLMAPVAVFFCLLAGLLFTLIGRGVQGIQLDERNGLPEPPEPPASDTYV
ncbi:transmembrane protein 182-like [Cyclopterus lumpus]|uniref:transmembrane protein 182-like n=1 Tax=Cyclopterus lumpus TaxID=8103 RepID=UPI001485E3C9|nr:transmembrane protein 182-like [Cyclopterus lumpus]